MPWIKLDTQFFDHPRVAKLSIFARSVFVRLLCAAKLSSKQGTLGADYLDPEWLCSRVGATPAQLQDVADGVAALIAAGMVTVSGDTATITHWDRHQTPSADRMRDLRGRDACASHAHPVTRCDAEASHAQNVTVEERRGEEKRPPNGGDAPARDLERQIEDRMMAASKPEPGPAPKPEPLTPGATRILSVLRSAKCAWQDHGMGGLVARGPLADGLPAADALATQLDRLFPGQDLGPSITKFAAYNIVADHPLERHRIAERLRQWVSRDLAAPSNSFSGPLVPSPAPQIPRVPLVHPVDDGPRMTLAEAQAAGLASGAIVALLGGEPAGGAKQNARSAKKITQKCEAAVAVAPESVLTADELAVLRGAGR